jgi:hypothetical protein
MKLKKLYEEITGNVTLYHKVADKKQTDPTEFIKNIVTNGLITHDNGEVGSVIWFSNDYEEYGKEGVFVLSLELNEKTKKQYEITYNGQYGKAYRNIPFKELKVVKIPVMSVRDRVTPSDKVINFIGSGMITIEGINKMKDHVVVYEDAFEKYVQPHINIPDFVSQLDCKKVNVL